VPAYIGYDATSEIPFMVGASDEYVIVLRWLQKLRRPTDHPDGDGTTKVGDPSFPVG